LSIGQLDSAHVSVLADSVLLNIYPDMPSLSPDPGFEYFFKACRNGDATAKVVTVGESAVRVLADASEITGLPRDNFEIHEITREEFEGSRSG
jgi:hypothetical protein